MAASALICKGANRVIDQNKYVQNNEEMTAHLEKIYEAQFSV